MAEYPIPGEHFATLLKQLRQMAYMIREPIVCDSATDPCASSPDPGMLAPPVQTGNGHRAF